jgi:hypothetical protein
MMISLKVSLAVNQPMELKAKLKINTDTTEDSLPFENLVIEALPANAEMPPLRLRIINTSKTQITNTDSKTPPDNRPIKIHWWQRMWF